MYNRRSGTLRSASMPAVKHIFCSFIAGNSIVTLMVTEEFAQ